jgi:hypothetical protein
MSADNDSDELRRLRARVAELEKAHLGAVPSDRKGHHSAARALAATICISIACLLAPVSVLSVWASTVIFDTDRYVETVAPVAADPGVQAAIADEVAAAILENLDVANVTSQALRVLADQEGMPPRVATALPAIAVPLTRGIEDFTRTQTGNFVSSAQFNTVWREANRIAHVQIVKLLEGGDGGALTAQDNQISLNLAPIIEEVKARLVDQGFALAANVPAVDRKFVLVESAGIGEAQRFYSTLNTLGVWLPFVALALLGAGVLLARDRRRALLRGALGVTAALVATGVGVRAVRMVYVQTTPANVLTSETAGNVFDSLVRFLLIEVRVTATLTLLVALSAFLTGHSSSAARARMLAGRGVDLARGSTGASGWHVHPAGRWVHRYRSRLWAATVLLAGLILVFGDQHTTWDVVILALVVVMTLFAIAFLGRPPVHRPDALRQSASDQAITSGWQLTQQIETPESSKSNAGNPQEAGGDPAAHDDGNSSVAGDATSALKS